MFSDQLPALLPGVRTPALVVWGDDDRIVPLDCGHQYAELLPNARLEVVAESGHNRRSRTPAGACPARFRPRRSPTARSDRVHRLLHPELSTSRPRPTGTRPARAASGISRSATRSTTRRSAPSSGDRYFDAKQYIDEIGFDGLMLNEHHATPVLHGRRHDEPRSRDPGARSPSGSRSCSLGNVLPIWDDPLWLVEELTVIDLISQGRLVSGWVRGTGRESSRTTPSRTYNWERFQEAHDFVVKAWTTPGPFRWEGKHFHYRYVNPFGAPYQQPHPPIWGAGPRQQGDRRVDGQAPLPVHDAREPARHDPRRSSTSTESSPAPTAGSPAPRSSAT